MESGCVIDHDFCNEKLLIDSLDHVNFIDRLIIPANEIAVKIHIQIIHGLYIRKRFVDINIIYVERMLWQTNAAFPEQSGTIDYGMH